MYNVCEEIMQICQNRHLDNFLFKYSSISHIASYGMIKTLHVHVCDWCLTHIIRINNSRIKMLLYGISKVQHVTL